MKTIFFFIILEFSFSEVNAQVSGNKNIPGDYPGIAAAIGALNAMGVGPGGVTFHVAAGFTETFASYDAGTLTTLTSSSTRPVVFRKSGSGANPLITAPLLTSAPAGTRGIIRIAGSDYVTFDGIDLRENPGNNAPLLADWGYALLKASGADGTQHVLICNCTVTLNRVNTSTAAIYSGNHRTGSLTPFTVTAVSGSNSWNRFYGNTLQNTYTGISLNGFADVAPYSYYDQGNEAGKDGANTITQFGGGSATACGVYGIFQNAIKVANNSISGGNATTGALYGVFLDDARNSSADIYNNSITLASSATGSLTTGICNAAGSGTGSTVNIYGNQVQNCSATAATTGNFYGIWNKSWAAVLNIYGNSVNGNTLAGTGTMYLVKTQNCTALNIYGNSLQNNQKTGPSGNMYCLATLKGEQRSYNNTIAFNSIPSTSGTESSFVFGLYLASTDSVSFHHNTIHDLSVGGTSTKGIIYIIDCSCPAINVFSNGFYNCQNTIPGNSNIYLTFSGYTSCLSFHHNTIYGLYTGGNTGNLHVLLLGGGTAPVYIYNNMISDIQAPNSASLHAITCLYLTNSPSRVVLSNNSFYLNAGFSNPNTSTTVIYAYAGFGSLLLNNNILINNSFHGPGGYAVVLWSMDPSFNILESGSDNNCYYAGVPSSHNLVYYDGVNACQTLQDFQTQVSPREMMSVSELPPFVNIAAAPYDLHLKTNVPTLCESGGRTTGAPWTVTDDYDGAPRYPLAGYPDNPSSPAKAPDIGADEFGGLWSDTQPPSISYIPLLNTSSGSGRTLLVSMADRSGIPVSGIGLPRLYWRIGSGSWNAVTGSSMGRGNYSFTFGAGAVTGNVVSYYIAAQDLAGPLPNVGSYPPGASGFSFNPPAASSPPAMPSAYTIVQPICGSFNVGAGQTYATLTAAINDFNAREITCAVTLYLTDNLYGPAESFPIVIQRNNGSSPANTLTIKPAPGMTPQVIGTPTGNALIKVLCSNVVVDGSNSPGGTTRDLTLTNNSPTASTLLAGSVGLIPVTDFTLKNANVFSTQQSKAVKVGDANAVALGNADVGGGFFNGVTISNNSIRRASRGIQVTSPPLAGAGTGAYIENNLMNGAGAECITSRGIFLYQITGGIIAGNNIENINSATDARFIQASPAPGAPVFNVQNNVIRNGIAQHVYGILSIGHVHYQGNEISGLQGNGMIVGTWAQYSSSVEIKNNRIFNLQGSSSSFYCVGIYITPYSDSVTIINNSVCNITNYGNPVFGLAGNAHGIAIYKDPNKHCIIQYNSISMPTAQNNPAGYLTGIYFKQSDEIKNKRLVDLRDNIISITAPSGAGRFAIASDYNVSDSLFSNLDNNDYYSTGSSLFYLQGSQVATLADWQAATGMDAHSLNADPQFVSATDLHTSRLDLNNAGVSIPGITTDLAGATRSNPPDMGAWEFTLPMASLTTLVPTGVAYNAATLNGSVNTSNEVVGMSFEYGATTAYGNTVAGVPSPVRNSSIADVQASVVTLVPNTQYHYRIKGVSTTSTEVKYGADVVFATPPNPTIAGEDTLCVNSGYYTYTTETGMSNYDWTVSPGGIITWGGGTHQVTVNWNAAGARWVKVNYMNVYGLMAPSPTQFNVTVKDVPAAAGAISGPTELCAGTTGLTYSTQAIPDAIAYVWSLPPGAAIVSGNWTANITVDYSSSALPGNIIVCGNNCCGNGAPSPPLFVNVAPIPPTPVVTLSGDSLMSNAPSGNQWFFEGIPIAGATGQTCVATQNGWYWDQVTLNGCVSDTSAHLYVLVTGASELTAKDLKIFPVPCAGMISLILPATAMEDVWLRIVNACGVTVISRSIETNASGLPVSLDLRSLPEGMYTAVVTLGNLQKTAKIIITGK